MQHIRGCQSWTIFYLSSNLFIFEYYALAKYFRLSQSKKPNFDYPQMNNNQKNIIKLSFCIHTQTNPSISKRTHSMPKLSKKALFIKEYEAVVGLGRLTFAFV